MSIQLVIQEYPVAIEQIVSIFRQRPALFQKTLQRMLNEDRELRWSLVIDLYLGEQISLAKAAEMLDLQALELQQRLIDLGIPLLLGPADLAAAKAEIQSITHWLTDELRACEKIK